MRYNLVEIDGVISVEEFNSSGVITAYYDLDKNVLTLNGSEIIIVIQADYVL